MTHARQEAIHISQMPAAVRLNFKSQLRHRDKTRKATGGHDTDFNFALLDEIEPWFEEFQKSAVILEAERRSNEIRARAARAARVERLRETALVVLWSAVAAGVAWGAVG